MTETSIQLEADVFCPASSKIRTCVHSEKGCMFLISQWLRGCLSDSPLPPCAEFSVDRDSPLALICSYGATLLPNSVMSVFLSRPSQKAASRFLLRGFSGICIYESSKHMLGWTRDSFGPVMDYWGQLSAFLGSANDSGAGGNSLLDGGYCERGPACGSVYYLNEDTHPAVVT